MRICDFCQLQKKCEKYWEEELNKTVEKGRGIEITTVKFKPYADYEVRDILVANVSDTYTVQLVQYR